MGKRTLTVEQEQACATFANLHAAYTAVRSRRMADLDRQRQAALLAALDVGTPPSALAHAANLSRSRINQITDLARTEGVA